MNESGVKHSHSEWWIGRVYCRMEWWVRRVDWGLFDSTNSHSINTTNWITLFTTINTIHTLISITPFLPVHNLIVKRRILSTELILTVFTSYTHIVKYTYHTTIRNKWDGYGLHHYNSSKRSVTHTPYTSRDFHHIQLITNQWNHTIDTPFTTTFHSIHYESFPFHPYHIHSLHNNTKYHFKHIHTDTCQTQWKESVTESHLFSSLITQFTNRLLSYY